VIGLRVNNYEIVSLLGEGGMGAVYLAEHPVMGRKAAVKFLRRELAEDKTLVARFINEARAANAIRHPNIIDIIDVGTLSPQGQPYMMMEFLEGESLAKRISRTVTLSPAEAVEVTVQTASALGAAHAKGIVHRDLKPDNLFLVPDEMDASRERVKVLDFGIAKLRGEIGSGSVKTHAGSIMGTPPYMSPEQCRGITEEIDHRTDVYALGIILYEMLTGAPPFMSAGFGEVLMMHLTVPPPPPRAKNPAIPAHVEAAILRALAKGRDERMPSMAEFQAVLRASPIDTLRTGFPVGGGGPVGGGPGVIAPTPQGATLRAAVLRTPVPFSAATGTFPPRPLTQSGSATRPSTTFSTATGEVPGLGDELAPRKSKKVFVAVGAGGTAGIAIAVFATLALRSSPAKGPPALLPPPAATAAAAPVAVPPPRPDPLPVAPKPAPPPAPPTPPAEEPASAAAPAPRPAREEREASRRSSRKSSKSTPAPVPASPPAVAARPAVAPPPATPAPAPAAPAPASPPPAAKKRQAEKW
jgi:serine/threonine-protein kinase